MGIGGNGGDVGHSGDIDGSAEVSETTEVSEPGMRSSEEMEIGNYELEHQEYGKELDKISKLGENPENEMTELSGKVLELVQPDYDEAQELAKDNEEGRTFTDHGTEHVEMVSGKILEISDAMRDAFDEETLGNKNLENRISFNPDMDIKTLVGSAISHDTGMKGDGYALVQNPDKSYAKNEDGNYILREESNLDFKEVRDNHSLNSAINILENREAYQELGYSDEQIDKMAAECMAHSKSHSGVGDLHSKADWSDCFDRMCSAVEAYNTDHPESPIAFDRSQFESSEEKMGQLAAETFALRIADVSRDSGADAESQSGEIVHVERSSVNSHGGSVEAEIADAKITIGENGELITNEKSKQVHIGEQNIIHNRTFVDENGRLTHRITVDDGGYAPSCTQGAISDHLGEFASARDEAFRVEVEFDKPCDGFAEDSYETFRDIAASNSDNRNITIVYPWDKEDV